VINVSCTNVFLKKRRKKFKKWKFGVTKHS
jgi:hypothetical protein